MKIKEEYLPKINEAIEKIETLQQAYNYEVFNVQIEQVTQREVYAYLMTDRDISVLGSHLDTKDYEDFQELDLPIIIIKEGIKAYLTFVVTLGL